MAAVLYTTTNSIRAAIGVVAEEVTDDAIVDLMVEDQLLVYLARNVPDHAAIAAAGTAPSPTDAEKAKYRSLRLLAMYAAAVFILQAGQYLLAQTLTDGGTTMSRFSKDDLFTTLARMEAQRDYYLGTITDPAGTGTSVPVPALVTVQPSYDPVTGC